MKYIDLHLHLDGALSIANVRTIAGMQNIRLPETDAELRELLNNPKLPYRLLQTKESITKAVEILLKELKEQDIIYTELRITPQLHTGLGLSQEDAIVAALQGIEQSGADCSLILVCQRGEENERDNLITCKLAERYLGRGVVAVDLAGSEKQYPNENFTIIFNYCTSKDIPFTVHCGTEVGAESVESALLYGARRLGHGLRAIEKRDVIKEIVDRKIPLEICPICNMALKVMPKAEYPLKKYIQMGVKVTINTDCPTYWHTNIKKEFEFIKQEFNITEEEINRIMLNTVEAAFVGEEHKAALRSKIFS